MPALVVPAVLDERHSAGNLVVLLELVDREQLGADLVQEGRHS
jgi:hypothetical protein